MASTFALARAPESGLLLMTQTGFAWSLPALQASMIACMLLPLWDARNPMFIFVYFL
jgi:hypothetical protein